MKQVLIVVVALLANAAPARAVAFDSHDNKPTAQCTRGLPKGGHESYEFFRPFSKEAFVRMAVYGYSLWTGEDYLIFRGEFPAHFGMNSWVTYYVSFNRGHATGKREFEFLNYQSPSQGTMKTGDGQKYQVRCELLDQRGRQ